MIRMIFICFIFVINIFATDATMEIIKDTTKLPTIIVENLNTDKNDVLIGNKIYKMLVADLKVSSHFNVLENNNGNKNINYEEQAQNNVNLVAHIKSFINNNETVATLIVYDINIKQAVLSKQYTVNQDSRYPFLSHKMAVDINDYIKAPSIEWMNRFVVFAKYTQSKGSHIQDTVPPT